VFSSMEVIKAPALKPGDTIAITAPAGPPNPNYLDKGVRFLSSLGYKVVLGEHLLSRQGYLAGSDAQRIADFNAFIHNPAIKAIFCARGGYGSARIVSEIDYDALKQNPKIVIGYSDITTFLMAIRKKTGLITFHGPLLAGKNICKWSFANLFDQICGRIQSGYSWPESPDISCNTKWYGTENSLPGQSVILGGCLSILVTLAGTPYQPDDEHFLFIEDTWEAPYKIDRMLHHLYNSSWLKLCRGIILGDFTNCVQRSDDPEPTPTTQQILLETFRKMDIPVFSHISAGHGNYNLTIPLGVRITTRSNRIIQLESAVK